PGATTYFQGRQLKIFDSELLAGGIGGSPGAIVNTTNQGFVVAAINGAIIVKRVQVEGSAKVASPEFTEQVNLKVGDRLGE
ncbi:unnamed protein product, partial [marine sediment metagenome]